MVAFAEWLFLVEREIIDRAVIQGYGRAFQQGLENLIQRTRDPVLRSTFEEMRQPLRLRCLQQTASPLLCRKESPCLGSESRRTI
jgi:hypothetical protein